MLGNRFRHNKSKNLYLLVSPFIQFKETKSFRENCRTTGTDQNANFYKPAVLIWTLELGLLNENEVTAYTLNS